MIRRWRRDRRTELSEYLDGTLGQLDTRALESRVAADPGLARELAELGGIRDMVASLPLEEPRRSFVLMAPTAVPKAPATRVPVPAQMALGLAAFAAVLFVTATMLVPSAPDGSDGTTAAGDAAFESALGPAKALAGDQAGGSVPNAVPVTGETAARDAQGPIAPAEQTRPDADGSGAAGERESAGGMRAWWRTVQVAGGAVAIVAAVAAVTVLFRTRREKRQ